MRDREVSFNPAFFKSSSDEKSIGEELSKDQLDLKKSEVQNDPILRDAKVFMFLGLTDKVLSGHYRAKNINNPKRIVYTLTPLEPDDQVMSEMDRISKVLDDASVFRSPERVDEICRMYRYDGGSSIIVSPYRFLYPREILSAENSKILHDAKFDEKQLKTVYLTLRKDCSAVSEISLGVYASTMFIKISNKLSPILREMGAKITEQFPELKSEIEIGIKTFASYYHYNQCTFSIDEITSCFSLCINLLVSACKEEKSSSSKECPDLNNHFLPFYKKPFDPEKNPATIKRRILEIIWKFHEILQTREMNLTKPFNPFNIDLTPLKDHLYLVRIYDGIRDTLSDLTLDQLNFLISNKESPDVNIRHLVLPIIKQKEIDSGSALHSLKI